MKISVSSYSFSRYLTEGTMDIFGLIKATAELGFDGIEFSGLKLPEGETDTAALAARVKNACAEAGLPIISYTIIADFITPPNGGNWQDEVERLKGEVDTAAILGAPRMRHDATRGIEGGDKGLAEFLEILPDVANGCRAVTEYAADKGIRTMVENHGFLIQDSERCAVLYEEINHANFGWLVDIGNFLCADDDPLRAVTRMAPHAIHAHAKDFHIKPAEADPGTGWFSSRGGNCLRGSIIGHGNVDTAGCIKALKDAGYDGYLSIEFEGMEDNRQALEIGLENLRRYSSLIKGGYLCE
ncbi:MAG: sugar phosphate isomerase/epimerase [bacterium]|nr:sugar phosphate isomerase/epimerase [bacterium]